MKFFSPGLNRKLELGANIVIILSGLLLGIRYYKPDLLSSPGKEPATILAGAKLDLPAVDWSGHDKTLVLALRQGCHFCAESAPFYQHLAREAERQSNGIHLMAVLPQELVASKKYLDGLGVPIGDVRKAELASLKIPYTPTLLLLDGQGVVREVWIGKLSGRGETQLLRKVGLAEPN